eukprot:757439-Hanusia_phi.AAC.5
MLLSLLISTTTTPPPPPPRASPFASDACGTELHELPYLHYAGNFWWTRCERVRELQARVLMLIKLDADKQQEPDTMLPMTVRVLPPLLLFPLLLLSPFFLFKIPNSDPQIRFPSSPLLHPHPDPPASPSSAGLLLLTHLPPPQPSTWGKPENWIGSLANSTVRTLHAAKVSSPRR